MKNELQTENTFPKILLIAPYCIIPADTGGKIRVFELTHGVSGHNIFLTVIMPMTPAQYSGKNIKKNLSLEVIPYPFILPFLFTGKPFSYSYLMSLHPGYIHFLKKYFKTFDIIQFEGVSFGDLVDYISPGKIVIYDAHNVEYDYEQFESRYQWINSISTRRIYKLEKKLSQRADRILTCSKGDAERLSKLYDMQDEIFSVIPNGIHMIRETPRMTVDQLQKKFPGFLDFPRRAIFSGSDVAHNRAAVRFLLESIAPQLCAKCAFVIQGQCGNRFKNYQINNLFFDTRPGNVGTYADFCTVALNPVTQGSGTSLKILDYLAHGLPVISTEFGMRGFEDLINYVVLSEPDKFIETILTNHIFQPEINSALEKYSWPSISKTLYNVYQSLV